MNLPLSIISGNLLIKRLLPPLRFSKQAEKPNKIATKKEIVEASLVSMLRKEERAGYELLYNSYSAVLFGVINKIIPDTHIAEDLLSEG